MYKISRNIYTVLNVIVYKINSQYTPIYTVLV